MTDSAISVTRGHVLDASDTWRTPSAVSATSTRIGVSTTVTSCSAIKLSRCAGIRRLRLSASMEQIAEGAVDACPLLEVTATDAEPVERLARPAAGQTDVGHDD